MSDLIQKADAIRNLARLYKHMIGAAEALESIGSLDQAKAEKEKILVDLDVQLADKRAEVEAQAGHMAIAQENAAEIVAKARSDAEKITADLKVSIERQIAGANADAAERLAKANADADAKIAGAKEMAAQFRAEADMLYAKGVGIQQQIDDQTAELDRLTNAITAARATMAQIMGR